MKLLSFITLTLTTLSAFAQVQQFENRTTIISSKILRANVQLTKQMVRCSHIGYGSEELKISVPALKYLAFFDHANIGETLPCMTAGKCKQRPISPRHTPADGFEPSDLIDELNPNQNIEIQQILTEEFTINYLNKSCFRSIKEKLDTNVRGIKFSHTVSKYLGEHPYEACLNI